MVCRYSCLQRSSISAQAMSTKCPADVNRGAVDPAVSISCQEKNPFNQHILSDRLKNSDLDKAIHNVLRVHNGTKSTDHDLLHLKLLLNLIRAALH